MTRQNQNGKMVWLALDFIPMTVSESTLMFLMTTEYIYFLDAALIAILAPFPPAALASPVPPTNP